MPDRSVWTYIIGPRLVHIRDPKNRDYAHLAHHAVCGTAPCYKSGQVVSHDVVRPSTVKAWLLRAFAGMADARGPWKLWLDDERPAPAGWIPCRWPAEVCLHIQAGWVSHVSLDHDLGDDARGTGYDVITWLEDNIDKFYDMDGIPKVLVHSANASAAARMRAGLEALPRAGEIWLMNCGYEWCDQHHEEYRDCASAHPWTSPPHRTNSNAKHK